jgi:programmed cell death 6-interacting protein
LNLKEELEASIPSSTIQSSSVSSPESKQTRIHARALRVKLEELDSLSRDRDQLVNRARRLAEADDIQPRILKVARGFERLTDVQPAMFEDVLDDELAKYDRILQDLADLEQKQIAILSDIEVRLNLHRETLLKPGFRASTRNL